MAFRLPTLKSKADVDTAFKYSVDKVLVFRFGRESDPLCAELDETVSIRLVWLSLVAANSRRPACKNPARAVKNGRNLFG